MSGKKNFLAILTGVLGLGAIASFATLKLALSQGAKLSASSWQLIADVSLWGLVVFGLTWVITIVLQGVDWVKTHKTSVEMTPESDWRRATVVVRNLGRSSDLTLSAQMLSERVANGFTKLMSLPRTHSPCWEETNKPTIHLERNGVGVALIATTEIRSQGADSRSPRQCNLSIVGMQGGSLTEVGHNSWTVGRDEDASIEIDIELSVVSSESRNAVTRVFTLSNKKNGTATLKPFTLREDPQSPKSDS